MFWLIIIAGEQTVETKESEEMEVRECVEVRFLYL